jgi:hypothetical protein
MTWHLGLLVKDEESRIIEKPFANVSSEAVNSLRKRYQHYILPNVNYLNDKTPAQFQLDDLSMNYVKSARKIHELFLKVGENVGAEELADRITQPSFAYASWDVYAENYQKTQNGRIPIAHYVPIYYGRIVVALLGSADNYPVNTINESALHEFFHHMHRTLHEYQFLISDTTMKETMAIMGERHLNYGFDYKEGTDHGKALALIKKMETHKRFEGWSFADKWNFLLDFRKYEDLEDNLDSKVIIFTSMSWPKVSADDEFNFPEALVYP